MRISVALCLWLLALSVSPAAAVDHGLQSAIEAVLEEEQLTGIAWTLISPGSELATGAAGFSNASTQTPLTADSRFHVGSVTKTVLATGVLRLVTLGEIDLDSPVHRYLPNLKLANPWAATKPVRVRHLLDHTSGMEDAHFWQLFSELPAANTDLTKALPESPIAIQSQPGTRFSYSNMGYTIMALVIEAIAEQPYEQTLAENLLLPLGMTDSSFEYTTQSGPDVTERLIWGHLDLNTPYAAPPMYLRPAGQFTTTAADLGKLASFLLGDGALADGTPFIDSKLIQQRERAANTEAFRHGLQASYSLGLARRDRHSVVGFCHTGSIIGFYAMLCVYPEEQKAFAYSVNTDSETADYSRLTALLIETLKLSPVRQPVEQSLPDDVNEWMGYYRVAFVRFKLFEYIDTVFGLRKLQLGPEGSGIDFLSLQSSNRHLRYSGDNLYRATDRTTTSHVFYRDADGTQVISDGFNTYEKVSNIYVFWHVGVLIAGLAGVIWILFFGLYTVIVNFKLCRQSSVLPALSGIIALALPVPVFFSQSFMALGDLTPASGLLALVTAAFPAAMVWTLIRVWLDPAKGKLTLATGTAAIFVLLWWLDMASFRQMPFLLWT